MPALDRAARNSARTTLLATAARIAFALGALASSAAMSAALAHGGAAHGHGAAAAAEPRRSEIGPYARDLPRGAAAPTDWSAPALRDDLGRLTWPAGTRDPVAQAYFDQGLRWAWAFNHAEAVRAFRAAQTHDAGCAMCYWGEAWALGPNINFPMDEASNARAIEALATARRLRIASPMHAALIEALSRRHSPDPNARRAELDRAYAEAMKAVQARFPEEAEVALLTADALMNLAPWDYWADGGRTPKGETETILALLEGILGIRPSPIAANPDHPGAIHLYIHTVEASDRPERAAPHATRLAALMPGAGHIVHMPSHLWYRLGQWRDSLESNRRAAAADEAQLARGGASLLYAEGYYAHNVHFIMASALMGGDGATAIEAAEKLARIVSERAAREVPWVQPILAAPYVARARFAAPEAVLAQPAPGGTELPFVAAHWRYARGVALARLGRAAEARAEAAEIERLAALPAIAALDALGVPGRAVLGIAAQVVRGRAAQAEGDHAEAVRRFAAAAEAQDALPYMEPPFWYYPVRQSLGAALLMAGRPAEAAAEFRATLRAQPNNGWAAAGLLRAAEAIGDAAAAREARDLLARSWFGAAPPPLEHL